MFEENTISFFLEFIEPAVVSTPITATQTNFGNFKFLKIWVFFLIYCLDVDNTLLFYSLCYRVVFIDPWNKVYKLHLFSKLRDLCSLHLKGISCVLAAVNQTSDDLFLFIKSSKWSQCFNRLNITERKTSLLRFRIYQARISQEQAVFIFDWRQPKHRKQDESWAAPVA